MRNFNIIRNLFTIILFATLSSALFAQHDDDKLKNQLMIDSNLQYEILYGKCDVEGLKSSIAFSEYYQNSINDYSIDSALIIGKSHLLDKVDITIVFGSWCSDSQRELPRFLEILNIMDYPMDNINIIAVDANKNVDGINTVELDINFVPTFIFYKNAKEIGRIVETPSTTLENNLLNIINKI